MKSFDLLHLEVIWSKHTKGMDVNELLHSMGIDSTTFNQLGLKVSEGFLKIFEPLSDLFQTK